MLRFVDMVLKYILEHVLPSVLCIGGLRYIDIELRGGDQIRLYRGEGRPFHGLGGRDTFCVVFRDRARRGRHLGSFSVGEKVDLARLVPDQVLSIKPLQLLGTH